jgi:hypothetical protein
VFALPVTGVHHEGAVDVIQSPVLAADSGVRIVGELDVGHLRGRGGRCLASGAEQDGGQSGRGGGGGEDGADAPW